MRVFVALLALFAFVGATGPTDWSRTTTLAPSGAFIVGNPAAKLRLVEYMSYTCPHCAHFAEEASAPLKRDYIMRGLVAFEVRNAVRDPLDLVAAIGARCGGAAKFLGNHEAVFAAQSDLFAKAATFDPAKSGKDPVTGMKALGRASGLSAVLAKRGITPAALDACIASKVAQAPVLAMTKEAWEVRKIAGTPTFFLNDKALGTNSWAGIEAELRTALGTEKAG